MFIVYTKIFCSEFVKKVSIYKSLLIKQNQWRNYKGGGEVIFLPPFAPPSLPSLDSGIIMIVNHLL